MALDRPGQALSEAVFTWIYRHNAFGSAESVSGPGSELAATVVLRTELAELLAELGARSLLDAPCGDFNWMKESRLDLDRYIGVDVVAHLIARNQRLYGSEVRTFLHRDITCDPLPRVDVILARDCLAHLPLADCQAAVRNFKQSGSPWLLASTYADCPENQDIIMGSWRRLNLQKPPFDFPPPHRVIDDPDDCADKRLALWPMESLPDSPY